jgi:peptide-methionine (S)-S-oxide reductase
MSPVELAEPMAAVADPTARTAPDALRTAGGGTQSAVLGGGCFWCLEAVFQRIRGVEGVTSGYAGGQDPAPTYRAVCTGTTGHAEVVRVTFLPDEVTYRTLLDIFFTIHDPTTPDRQGGDRGPQYRSVILYDSPEQEREAREVIAAVEAEERWPGKIVTEVAPLGAFFPAEEEHWDYYRRNPNQAYCSVVISPKLAKAREAFRDLFRD